MPGAAGVTELDTLPALLKAAAQRDRQAFARLYKLSAPTLYAVALRMLRRRDLADDVLQESYLAIWQRAGQFDVERGQPLSWMIAIVRHRAIDRMRRQTRQPAICADLADVEDLAEAEPTGGDAQGTVARLALQRCLGRLKAGQQRAIRLAYCFGLTHEELARHLDVPLGTVKTWVRRGLLQLKECLN